LALECQKLGYKASQASLYGARVDLGYYQEKNSDGSRDSQGSAQIRLTIPFDLGRVNEHLAEAKNISASELDLEGAIQDVDKDLKNTYVSLRSIEKSLSSYERINAINAKKIEGYLSRLSSLSEDELDDLLSLLSTSQSYRSILNRYYVQAINLKYNIQRNIGTLFETNSVEVDALGGNVRIREGN